MDPATFRSMVKSFLAGLIAVLVILAQSRVNEPVINPTISFFTGVISRGLSQFLSIAIDDGGWRESFREGFIGVVYFMLGGVFPLLLGLSGNDVLSHIILGSGLGVFVLYAFLMNVSVLYRNLNINAEGTRVFGVLGVVIALTVLMMGISSLRR